MISKPKQHYFDYAAATPVDERVISAMQSYWQADFYNPSSIYLAARKPKKGLDEARAEVAHWLGAKPSEIIFTAGATEANNLAIKGVLQQHQNSNIVISSIEHEAVLAPAESAGEVRQAAVNKFGQIDLKDLEK